MNDAILPQLESAKKMRDALDAIPFEAPVACVYDPLDYAWAAYEEYVQRYGGGRGRILFLGMNPGPWGMVQTGVPFGEADAVRSWLGIDAAIGVPRVVHPKYPVDGYDTPRSEVSGRRLWGLFRDRFGRAENFFERHFVLNYCPLLFIAGKILKNGRESAANLTPDKLEPGVRKKIYDICDENLRVAVRALAPSYIVGIGNFAAERARLALGEDATDEKDEKSEKIRIGKILHPSPASPKSNADWAGEATRQMVAMGLWEA